VANDGGRIYRDQNFDGEVGVEEGRLREKSSLTAATPAENQTRCERSQSDNRRKLIVSGIDPEGP
jgi:hypothetical protein